MTEEEKHQSSIREKGVEVVEVYFEDYNEKRKLKPESAQKIERSYREEYKNEINNQTRSEFITTVRNLVELEKTNIENRESFINNVEKLIESQFAKLEEANNKIFDDVLKLTETISDFVIYRKNMILQQETDEEKKKAIKDSIAQNEMLKKVRIEADEKNRNANLNYLERTKRSLLEIMLHRLEQRQEEQK